MANESTRLEKRAPAIKVNVHSAASCQPLPISWDASAGKAPWTLMIAPVNNVPYTFSVPKVSQSDFPVAWIVPKVAANTQAIVAVADASGAYSGVSSLFTISSGSGSCPGMKQGLDFIWYPTGSNTRPSQCSEWGVTWDKEKGDGVQGQVSFTLLPENGQPVTVTGGSGNSGTAKFAIPFAAGTQFVAVANDGGKYGTGGVGTNPYTVTRAKKAAKACKLSSTSGNGLPSPSQTLQSVSTQSASGSTSSGKSSSKTSSGAAAKSPTGTAQSAAADSTEKKSSSAGTAVGATFGVLAALGLIAFLVWWFRRRRAQEAAEKVWGGRSTSSHNLGSDATAIGHPGSEKGGAAVSPWRFSASPYEPPQTTSRASKWMQRASGVSGGNGGFRILSRGRNDMQQHSRSESLTTSIQPTMQQATFRNISYPQKTFDAASVASTHDQHFPRSPSPTLSQRNDVANSNRSIHSTVPDTQLFPPPSARAFMSMDDSPYGIARQQQQLQHQQQQQQQQEQQLYVSSPTAYSPNGDVRVRSPFEDPESAPPPPAKEYDVSRTVGAGVGAGVGAMGMPMQSSQSQQSYQLDSPTSEVRKGTLNEEPVRQMSPNPSGFSAQQRIPPPILSEVMMPERYMANSQRIQRTATEDDEDEGLPYL